VELLKFQFQPYSRPFKTPLKTHHGLWEVREGIVLQLTGKDGKIGWGEISPLSWFGSETLADALNFCDSLPSEIDENTIFSIPETLPACQFGFESAWENLQGNLGEIPDELKNSGLLPAGEAVLSAWRELVAVGYQTLKWKIGVDRPDRELNLFEEWVGEMRAIEGLCLRLDANGGLTFSEADRWLQVCDKISETLPNLTVEFLEQPLPVDAFDRMLELGDRHSTPLALDESIATLPQMRDCYRRGWRGIFVIKPAIAGSPRQLGNFCRTHAIDAVFSSVFETEIGRQAALRLAAELGGDRAVGFGVDRWLI
jgi:O-succinylbenzoate synthase